MEMLLNMSLVQRLAAVGLVCVTQPDAFGVPPEVWTSPPGLTWALLGLLMGGWFHDRKTAAAEKKAAAIEFAKAVQPSIEPTNDGLFLEACRRVGIDPESVSGAFLRELGRDREHVRGPTRLPGIDSD